MEFEKLPLHDASITSICYEWESKSVFIVGKRYDSSIKQISVFTIQFTNAKLLVIPHAEEWGGSNSILETTKMTATEFQIQMQSGDLIMIAAKSFSFE